MDKEQLQAELTRLGIPFRKNLGEAKLQALLDAHNEAKAEIDSKVQAAEGTDPVVPTTDPVPTPPVEEEKKEDPAPPAPVELAQPETPPASVPSGIVKIRDASNRVIRTFSLEEHGDDYVELAQEFAKKRNFRIS